MSTPFEQLRRDIETLQNEIQEQTQTWQDLQHISDLLEDLSHQKNQVAVELTLQILEVKLKTKTLKKLQTLEDQTRQAFRHFLDQWAEQLAQDLDSDSDSDTDPKDSDTDPKE